MFCVSCLVDGWYGSVLDLLLSRWLPVGLVMAYTYITRPKITQREPTNLYTAFLILFTSQQLYPFNLPQLGQKMQTNMLLGLKSPEIVENLVNSSQKKPVSLWCRRGSWAKAVRRWPTRSKPQNQLSNVPSANRTSIVPFNTYLNLAGHLF